MPRQLLPGFQHVHAVPAGRPNSFRPCRVEEVRQGDVIIFAPPGQEERVVHRVVSTGPGGIRT
jgi:hypothetical protein